MTTSRARAAVTDLRDLPVRRYPLGPLMDRVWNLHTHVSPYDATYLALAEGLDCPLLTRDEHLARSHGHTARIVVVP